MWRWIAQFICWIVVLGGLLNTTGSFWTPDILTMVLGFVFSSIIGVPVKRPPGAPPPLPPTSSWAARTFSLRRWPWFVIPGLIVLLTLTVKLGLAGQALSNPAKAPTIVQLYPWQFPPNQFTTSDLALAQRLGHSLPAPVGQSIPETTVWESRQRMFLALPENAYLTRSNSTFDAWTRSMQVAADDAAKQGFWLDDYQLMETARDRL